LEVYVRCTIFRTNLQVIRLRSITDLATDRTEIHVTPDATFARANLGKVLPKDHPFLLDLSYFLEAHACIKLDHERFDCTFIQLNPAVVHRTVSENVPHPYQSNIRPVVLARPISLFGFGRLSFRGCSETGRFARRSSVLMARSCSSSSSGCFQPSQGAAA
jgi:hypothetical protein